MKNPGWKFSKHCHRASPCQHSIQVLDLRNHFTCINDLLHKHRSHITDLPGSGYMEYAELLVLAGMFFCKVERLRALLPLVNHYVSLHQTYTW